MVEKLNVKNNASTHKITVVFTLSTPRNTRKCCLSTIVVVCSIDATKTGGIKTKEPTRVLNGSRPVYIYIKARVGSLNGLSRSKHALAPCVSRQQTGSSRPHI